MKYVNTDQGFGHLEGDHVVIRWSSASDFFDGEAPDEQFVAHRSDVRLLAVSPKPQKVICVGLNYRAHALEAGMAIPDSPVLFPKFANSVVGPSEAVRIPPVVDEVDYEAELAVVIGRRCSRVSRLEALEYVAGFCCANDLSSRRLQFRTPQWLPGKAIDGFLPLGPWLVTPDEVGDVQNLGIRCFVNGQLRQESNTGDMIFGVAELLEVISSFCTLEPGDVVSTGTPSGVAMAMQPPAWLQGGDSVTVEIDRLGQLTTDILD